MDIFEQIAGEIREVFEKHLGEAYSQNDRLQKALRFSIPPMETGCDYSTNGAMVFAKVSGKKPNDLAQELASKIEKLDGISSVQVVGGYINLVFTNELWERFLASIISQGEHFGDGKKKEKVLLEFVSANPTGPLHVGHCRGAILGLALAKLMSKAGYDVTKEYYVNDYGVQIGTLLKSIQFRYEQNFGLHKSESVPEGCYPGEYLVDYAKLLAKKYNDKYVGISEKEFYEKFKSECVEGMLDIIRADLKLLGLEFDNFTSETKLVNEKKVEKVLDMLEHKFVTVTDENGDKKDEPLVYRGNLSAPIGGSANEEEQEESKYSELPQTLFRSTAFGDDKDRVVARPDGTTTYFASDIAYHKDKFDRGFNFMINILGADHGGYVKRITSAVEAVSDGKAKLQVLLCQMVALEKNGEPFKMSKRKGTFVLLSDVAKEINVDELKLFMLSKSAETQMTFDLVKIKEKSKDNIVYYIQYAYVRANSALRNFKQKFGYDYKFSAEDLKGILENSSKQIKEIVVFLAKYPQVIELSASKCSPHMVVDYVKELASLFHSLWSANDKLVDIENLEYSKKMMALVSCVKTVIKNALECISVGTPEKM
jgi:arginyl-tRNA synthetase